MRSRPRAAAVVAPLCLATPGRARWRVAGLRGRRAVALHLEDRLSTHGAIQRVRASPVTGSLLVFFDVRLLSVTALEREIRHQRREVLRDGRGLLAHETLALAPSLTHVAWHAVPADEVVAQVGAALPSGLSATEAAARLATTGPNQFPASAPKSAVAIVWEQVATVPVALLGVAAIVSIVSGGLLDAVVIIGVVAINTAVGYVTESRVERIIASLQELTVPMAFVRRDGKEIAVPAASLVPGDVMVLRSGYDVPADGRMVESDGLAVNESALTGESVPAAKHTAAVREADRPLADRDNMVYAGTVVAEGSGIAVVTETGRQTELGRIRALVAEASTPATPLERQLDTVGRQLVGVSMAMCGVAFGLGLLRGVPAFEMLRTAISLAVAAVPEGLPAVATTTLALGMRRMFERNIVVRRLAAVESLGATTVICVDKTGTITENRMTVSRWHLGRQEHVAPAVSRAAQAAVGGEAPTARLDPLLERALAIGALCNEAELIWGEDGISGTDGSGTEAALLLAALDAGIDYRELRRAFPLLAIRPRGDGENWMATSHAPPDGRRLLMVKGAPEEVLRRSREWLPEVIAQALLPQDRQEILAANARLADQGMRVLGLAFRDLDAGADPDYDGLVWVGLVGLTDPIRDGVGEAIAACHQAGIRTVIITGDQSRTAVAVGRQLGLVKDDRVRVLEASQLAQVSPDVLRGLAREVDVFARVSPAHKYQIVRALQTSGEIVAMTGDGVNDAPALKAADIGVAMGGRGTALARDLADVVLLDDNFGSLVVAVEQGRTLYGNIQKALRFLLATNFSEILVTVGALAVGVARPMSAFQFLWINLLTDVFPALALAMEPAEPDVLTRPPRPPQEPILSGAALARIAGDAGVISAVSLGAYGLAVARYGVGATASTVAFSTLTSAQLCYALSCRSEQRSGLAALGRNPMLVTALGGSLLLQIASVTAPPLRRLLGTTPLGASDWGLVAAGAVAPLVVRELTKAARPVVKAGAPARG